MRIVATSDLHGSLPDIPECDLLIVAGDVCPDERTYQREWLEGTFLPWLEASAKDSVWVAGNHDFVLEKEFEPERREGIHYLRDSAIRVGGLSIYGTPWTPNLPGWAFQSENRAAQIFSWIPDGLDILVSHGPPLGYGDKVVPGSPLKPGGHVGCPHLLSVIEAKKPRFVICGHIHEAHGLYQHPELDIDIINVAHMNERYEPVNPPVLIETP